MAKKIKLTHDQKIIKALEKIKHRSLIKLEIYQYILKRKQEAMNQG